jgi:tetratricopeptide (TPR) repeat protein
MQPISMTFSTRSIIRATGVVTLAVLATGCAAGRGGVNAIPRLEQQRDAKPNSASIRTSLGITYFKANRLAEARPELEQAVKLDPKNGTAALYLGMTAEAQNDLTAARTAYTSYLKVGRTNRVRKSLEQHLAAITRKEIEASAKAAILNERQLTGVAGNPRTVAVMPFAFIGADTTLKSLERGFAELVTTDLARFEELTVVERARLQAILDELNLQASGATDASTNVRMGKLIQAGKLVSGKLEMRTATQMTATAAVVDVTTGQASAAATSTDALEALFKMENDIVFSVVESMGIRLTTAMRNRIEQRPTKSVQAFISFSRGLAAEDRGNYDEASRFFQDASRLDPNFNAPQQKAQEVRNVVSGGTISAAVVESGLQGSAEGAVVNAAVQGVVTTASTAPTTTALAVAATLNPSTSGAATGATVTSAVVAPTNDGASSGTGAATVGASAAFVPVRLTQPGGGQ